MFLNLESSPSDIMRWKRYVPTGEGQYRGGGADLDSRLAAHIVTAALSATCRQLKPRVPAVPLNGLSRLGPAGNGAPATAAALLARRAGRNKLKAVHEM